jgi:hypothetical protein
LRELQAQKNRAPEGARMSNARLWKCDLYY